MELIYYIHKNADLQSQHLFKRFKYNNTYYITYVHFASGLEPNSPTSHWLTLHYEVHFTLNFCDCSSRNGTKGSQYYIINDYAHMKEYNRKLGRCDIDPRTADVKFWNTDGKNHDRAITNLQGTHAGIDCNIIEYIQCFGGKTCEKETTCKTPA